MEPTPPSSGDTYSPDIPSFDSLPETGAPSFTALLGLVPSVAVELLHDSVHPPEIPPSSGGDVWRLPVPLGCSPTFPSYVALVDRAARLSVFAADDSPKVERSPPARLKAEQADSCDRLVGRSHRLTGKRKGGGGGGGSKMNMSKTGGEEEEEEEEEKKKKCTGGDEKPLPYVHVRARRGQATDSHSLAERARREKINARMKLLQELVPGCNKISGTALVLDEIINHVQSLQRQVEFLSMQLAAVNPRVDFSSLDTILSAECVQLMEGDRRNAMGLEQSSPWSTTDGTTNGDRQQQQQLWHVDLVQQQEQLQQWERDEAENPHHQLQHHGFLEQPGSSPFPT